MLDKLTDAAIRNAKPKATPYKLADGGGMYLLVTPKGQRWWRFDYRHAGKRNTVSLGVYPDVGLKEARSKRQELRTLVAAGACPSDARKDAKTTRVDTLKAVSEEWLAKQRPT